MNLSNLIKIVLVATIQELHSEIQNAVHLMRQTNHPITAVVSASISLPHFSKDSKL